MGRPLLEDRALDAEVLVQPLLLDRELEYDRLNELFKLNCPL